MGIATKYTAYVGALIDINQCLLIRKLFSKIPSDSLYMDLNTLVAIWVTGQLI